MKTNIEAHWRDSARSLRFFIWDGKTAFPFAIALVHLRLWTLAVAFVVTMFFTILQRYGLSIYVFARLLRSYLVGRRKIAIPWWME